MKIVILDDEGKVLKETPNLTSEGVSLVGISIATGLREMGNENKKDMPEVLNTFVEATRELTDRSHIQELMSKK